MKTVGEFKKAGLQFVNGDVCDDGACEYSKDGWVINANGGSDMFFDCNVKSFAWRDLKTLEDGVKFDVETDKENHRWRPSLNQPSLSVESDTKQSAIHKAWVTLSGKVKAISDEWKTLWHVKDGNYINGEYFHSFNDKCGEAGAKFVCTTNEFKHYCEYMAAEENRMDIIGKNYNDGLHYDNKSKQDELMSILSGAMKLEIENNSRKGDFFAWSPSSDELVSEINHHVAKLNDAIYSGFSTREYAADVANYMLKCIQIDCKVQDSNTAKQVEALAVNDKPIFTQAMACAGELPPVGAKCVYVFMENGSEYTGSIAAIDGDVIWFKLDGGGYKTCFGKHKFKAVDNRTDREKAIDEMLELDLWATDREFLEAVYDAGYRKC